MNYMRVAHVPPRAHLHGLLLGSVLIEATMLAVWSSLVSAWLGAHSRRPYRTCTAGWSNRERGKDPTAQAASRNRGLKKSLHLCQKSIQTVNIRFLQCPPKPPRFSDLILQRTRKCPSYLQVAQRREFEQIVYFNNPSLLMQ